MESNQYLESVIELIEGAQDLLDGCDWEFERTLYGLGPVLCPAWNISNPEYDSGVSVIFDQHNDHLDKRGRHLTLEHDAHEFVNIMDECRDDGTMTIWIHVDFKGGK